MPFILGANTLSTGAYEVANSCRFQDSDSSEMSRSIGSTGSNTTWTVSAWVKRVELGQSSPIFGTGDGNANNDARMVFFDADDKIECSYYNSGYTYEVTTNRLFRDVSAWYHICILFDTTESTEADRIKIYVNGVKETSFATSSYPSENASFNFGNTSYSHFVNDMGGRNIRGSHYIAELVYLDGTALAVTNFGEFDEDSPNIWRPIDVSGLSGSKGTNGFYMDFEDSSNLGNDVFGGTDFTESNLDAQNQTTDTCTNNFCTCNPLDQTNTGGSSATMAEGNLKWTSAGNTTSQSYMRATFGLTAGKWYWEAKMSDSNSGVGFNIGVAGSDANMNAGGSGSLNDSDPNTHFKNSASTNSATKKDGSNVTTNLTTVAENQIVQIALDLDNQKFYAGVQGTWLNSADPAAGSNEPATVDANTTYLPAWSDNGYTDQITLELNFGNPTFSGTDKSDGNGYGSFEYEPPSGYLALCTKNLGSDGG